MDITYNYKTGNIESDGHHFVRWDQKCKLSGLPCRAGSDRCTNCKSYEGSIHPFTHELKYGRRLNDSYVICSHPEQKDSENCGEAYSAFHEMIEHDAMCALCH